MKTPKKPVPEAVRAMLDEAQAQTGAQSGYGHAHGFDETGEPGAATPDAYDPAVVADCAGLDHSDTDNAIRLQRHFGRDLVVLTQEKARSAAYGAWVGTHWDFATGGPRAFALAQQLGGLIALEGEHIGANEREARAIDAAADVLKKDPDEWTKAEKRLAGSALSAQTAIQKRQSRRATHAVSSKNKGKIEAMLACLAPHVMRQPDEFNAHPLRFATLGHTLTFSRRTVTQQPAKDDADDSRESFEETLAELAVRPGHDRTDLITRLVPVNYDPKAACPAWLAFLEQMLPDADVRRFVQIGSGLGLVGTTVQYLFFHYGKGANGKSVYMETLCRLLGDAAVTLPATSFTGEGNSGGGGASPDLARLYGRTFLRVKELPEGEDLREALVKEATGGESIAVRDLFQGYFDFKPIFTPHMSGNGMPRISGNDEGIWRRMAVVHWPVSVAEGQRRDFETMVESFRPEWPGILNWMIGGVMEFLRNGVVLPQSVRDKTAEYRSEMDPTSGFCLRCVRHTGEPRDEVQARDFYQAYVDFTLSEGGKPVSLSRFGLIMKRKYERVDGRIVKYVGIKLSDVPAHQQAWERGQ